MENSSKFYEKFIQNNVSKSKKQNSKITPNFEKSRDKKIEIKKVEQNKNLKSDFSVNANNFSLENSLFSSEKIPTDAKKILEDFDKIIQSVRPLNSRQIQQLPENIKNLSHQLTDKRSERRLGYLNDNIQLSSYVRYYTWWNLVRLTKLFANLPKESFPQNDQICLDVGTGPLTVITALWLARPELRKLKLVWYCIDISANSMIFGEDIYFSTAAKTPQENAWKIIRVKGAFGTQIKQKADFITCANMLNETDQNSQMPPEYQSKKYFQQFKNYGTQNAKWLFTEPGVPKASRTLSLLRMRFLDEGKKISAPCSHSCDCPMNGFKAYTGSNHKWCNFAFLTDDAPIKLQKLSEKAKLPKERATLSFLSVISQENVQNSKEKQISKNEKTFFCRIVSDEFKVGTKKSYYACSELGLTLLKLNSQSEKEKSLASGDLIKVKIKTSDSLKKDEKSGAVIINI